MAAKLIIAPEAEQDLGEAYAWYEYRRAGLGEEFLMPDRTRLVTPSTRENGIKSFGSV